MGWKVCSHYSQATSVLIMKVLVTGATGFVGQHVVREMLRRGHEVIAVVRNPIKAKRFDWFDKVEFIKFDIHIDTLKLSDIGDPAILIHLAWGGLPNYNSLHHLDDNLIHHMSFLSSMIEQGILHIMVTGTCFEYGNVNGELSEDMPSLPDNAYSIAKNVLREWLQLLQIEKKFRLQWVRLFYMYGEGQNSNSLLAQLENAIHKGDSEFNMSMGEQLRDYLSINDVAEKLTSILESEVLNGIINCASGKPISVRQLVEDYLSKKNKTMKLNFGFYPYNDYEPMAFWANMEMVNQELARCKEK
jgi:nucleoside-diphosphate-sugar epimerase